MILWLFCCPYFHWGFVALCIACLLYFLVCIAAV